MSTFLPDGLRSFMRSATSEVFFFFSPNFAPPPAPNLFVKVGPTEKGPFLSRRLLPPVFPPPYDHFPPCLRAATTDAPADPCLDVFGRSAKTLAASFLRVVPNWNTEPTPPVPDPFTDLFSSVRNRGLLSGITDLCEPFSPFSLIDRFFSYS